MKTHIETRNKQNISIGETIYLEDIFTHDQWKLIESLVDEVMAEPHLLETITKGQGQLEYADFSLQLYKFITRENGTSTTQESKQTKRLLKIIDNSRLIEHINRLCNKKIAILRMQLNIMREGGYVSKHADYASDSAYICSVLIRAKSDYLGGDLVIYNDNGISRSIRQPDHSILAMSSRTEHAVQTVSAGSRYTICLFCG